jgi:hypothetical protein
MLQLCHISYRENTPRCGFAGTLGSLLFVPPAHTAGQASSGTQTGSVPMKSTSWCSVSIDIKQVVSAFIDRAAAERSLSS